MAKNLARLTVNKQDMLRASRIYRTVQRVLLAVTVLFSLALALFAKEIFVLGTLIACGVCVLCLLLSLGIWHWICKHYYRVELGEAQTVLENITMQTLYQMAVPILVCHKDGKIIWYNTVFSEKNGNDAPIYGKKLQDITGVSLEELAEASAQGGLRKEVFRYVYDIHLYSLEENNADLYITVWEDKTQEAALQRTMQARDTVFAYILIDNLQELSELFDKTYRGASAHVAEILQNWAKETGGFLTECGNDKYLLVCEAAAMQRTCENKFEVLDSVREMGVSDGSTPLTVSIGVSRQEGTLAEKEAGAQTALELALQRGGDQAVVRTASGLEFYGGRTRAIQKRTKVRSRVIGNELIRLMRESSNILVMGHRNEDFDALGACVGIARMAMYLGKQVRIVANEEDENLALCFETLYAIPEYKKIFVSGVDAQELVQSGTLLVIVDVNRGAQFAAPDLADAVQRRVVIDHHRKSGDSKHEFLISYIEPSASSACELVTELIEQTLPAATLHHEEADVMYSGIVLDTKQFKHNIGVRTFSSAMFLRNEGADPEKAQALFKTNLADFQRLSKFEEDVLIYRGVCAISVYDGDDADDNDRVAAAKVADRLLSLRHVQASFVLCRIDNVICVSARSEGMWNVQSILERLGGGGHFDAAGAQLRGVTMEQAKEKLQEAINIHINQM